MAMFFRSLAFAIVVVAVPGWCLAGEPTVIFGGGEDFDRWTGRNDLWTVEGDEIVGKTEADKPIKANTFLIYQGETFADFELTLLFKIKSGNSGVQYRSEIIDADTFVVGGYQADIDFANRYSGIVYEEKKRGILVNRGTSVTIGSDGEQSQSRFASDAAVGATIHPGKWNEMRIVAKGTRIQHFINGSQAAELHDLDPSAATDAGVIALQLHRGDPMEIRFKTIILRPL